MTTFHDGDLSSALRRMAKRNRDEAADLLRAADELERSAAILDKQKYDTVPLAAVRDAVQIDLEEVIAAKAAPAKSKRRPSPAIQAKRRAVDGYKPERPEPTSIPGQIVLDMLREAGAAGEKPSTLRVECGLEPAMFRQMMDALMQAGAVVREREAHGPVESIRYRLKEHAQRTLANAAPLALDGRDEENRP